MATCCRIITLCVVFQLYHFHLAKLMGGWNLLFDPLWKTFGCFQCLNWTWAFLHDFISVLITISARSLAGAQKTLLTILVFENKSRYLNVSVCGFIGGCQLLDRTVDFCT